MAILFYVDDEETIGRAVARWFARRGHTVHVAPSVAAARALLAEHDPDVLFIDVWLGTESGFELMSWIEDARPELANRVTFVTGELVENQRSDRVFRTLGRPVIQKPFDFAELQRHAEASLRGAPPPAPAPAAPPPDAEPRVGT